MEMAAREARAKEVGGRLHRPHRPQGTNPPDGTTTARAPGQAPYVGYVTTPPSKRDSPVSLEIQGLKSTLKRANPPSKLLIPFRNNRLRAYFFLRIDLRSGTPA